jgi:DNA-directed RNA polymerase beta subunit
VMSKILSVARSDKLSMQLAKAIQSGTDAKLRIGGRAGNDTVTNRLTSIRDERAGPLMSIENSRMITPAKAAASHNSARAIKVREVHPAYYGYLDPVLSPTTGSGVGLNRRPTVGTTITLPVSTASVIEAVLEELADTKDFIALADLDYSRAHGTEYPSKLFVNGRWLGNTRSAGDTWNRFIKLRRDPTGRLDKHTTVYWNINTRDVELRSDGGRLIRPLMIVHHEGDTRTGRGFRQYVKLTRDHIAKLRDRTISLDDLVREQVIEWVAVIESKICVIAPSIEDLQAHETDFQRRFSHCDIPQAILGVSALSVPFLNMSQLTRGTTGAGMARQGTGRYTADLRSRSDRKTLFCPFIQWPVVSTFTSRILPGLGVHNTIMAINVADSYNQEDAVAINGDAVDLGPFISLAINYIKTEVASNEVVQPLNPGITKGRKQGNYGKVGSRGVVPIGTILNKGDIVIAKFSRIDQSQLSPHEHGLSLSDISITYEKNEPALVTEVIRDADDSTVFYKVLYRSIRLISVGDKFADRQGQKGVVSKVYRRGDMPFTADGQVVDILVSALGIPTRMTIGGLLQSLLAKLCAYRGTTADGTPFTNVNIKQVAAELTKLGYNGNGTEKLYHGITGEIIYREVLMVPNGYQLLNKASSDTFAIVNKAATDVMTRQPTEGKSARGGLRMSELQMLVLAAQGCPLTMLQKSIIDSDPFDIFICTSCNQRAVFNGKTRTFKYSCANCGDMANIVRVPTTYASKLMMQEIESIGIGVEYMTTPPETHVTE